MIKNIIGCCLLAFLMTGISFSATAQSKGYSIRVKIDGYENDTLLLGYHQGPKIYSQDTAIGTNDQGEFVFTNEEALPGGLYFILTKPDNVYFNFIVSSDEDQQDLRMSTSTAEGRMTFNLKVENSIENTVYIDYMNFLDGIRTKGSKWQEDLQKAQEAKDTEKEAATMTKLQELDKEVRAYQANLFEKYPDHLTCKLIKANENPVIPKAIEGDRVKSFYYYRKHFFDGLDWTDSRLIRTDVFLQRVEQYIDQLTVQHPDSVIATADYMIDKALEGGNQDMYEFMANLFLNRYAKSELICMDAVYVHVGEKHFCTGENDWVDAEQLEKICDDVNNMKGVRCGMLAPSVKLRDIQTEKQVDLYEIKAEYTLVYFWDPTCGNCTKNTKKLVPIYNELREKGVEIAVVGICSKSWDDKEGCVKKIQETGMPWYNLSDASYPLNMTKKRYNLKANPTIYMLDKDKHILWKNIVPEQVKQIIEDDLAKKTAEK